MKWILSLATALLLIPVPSGFAVSIATEIKPDDRQEKSFKFDITAKAVPGGMVEFRVVISENRLAFVHPSTVLGIAKITPTSERIGGDHVLPQEKKGRSITCVFTVPEKSLGDPDYCFIFTNAVEAVINGKVEPMPDADIFYARLRNYYKKQP